MKSLHLIVIALKISELCQCTLSNLKHYGFSSNQVLTQINSSLNVLQIIENNLSNVNVYITCLAHRIPETAHERQTSLEKKR